MQVAETNVGLFFARDLVASQAGQGLFVDLIEAEQSFRLPLSLSTEEKGREFLRKISKSAEAIILTELADQLGAIESLRARPALDELRTNLELDDEGLAECSETQSWGTEFVSPVLFACASCSCRCACRCSDSRSI